MPEGGAEGGAGDLVRTALWCRVGGGEARRWRARGAGEGYGRGSEGDGEGVQGG